MLSSLSIKMQTLVVNEKTQKAFITKHLTCIVSWFTVVILIKPYNYFSTRITHKVYRNVIFLFNASKYLKNRCIFIIQFDIFKITTGFYLFGIFQLR